MVLICLCSHLKSGGSEEPTSLVLSLDTETVALASQTSVMSAGSLQAPKLLPVVLPPPGCCRRADGETRHITEPAALWGKEG